MKRLDVILNAEEERAFDRILKERKTKDSRATAASVVRELVKEEARRLAK